MSLHDPWRPPPASDVAPSPGRAPGGVGGGLVALVVGGAVLVVVLAVAAVVVGVALLRGGGTSLADVGVPASEAGCDDVVRDPGKGIATHVGPGTSEPDRVVVEYDTVPPSSGPHLPVPLYPAAPFYDVADAPVVEQLVHNLEHGYTLVWYDTDLPADQVDDLRTVADLAREDPATGGKLVVVPWDGSHGDLPADRPVALSHWTADGGVRQLCGSVSGEVVQRFVEDFPAADSPEPNAP